MYQLILEVEAQIFFENANSSLQKRLGRCFEALRQTPTYHPNVKAMKGNYAGFYRYRVGDYRVVYYVEEDKVVVVVTNIGHRRDVYE